MFIGDVQVGSLAVASIGRVLDHELRSRSTCHMQQDAHATHDLVRVLEFALMGGRHIVEARDLSTSANWRRTSILRVSAAKETTYAE
eukprot:6987491-Prymnesium_polylepis.1